MRVRMPISPMIPRWAAKLAPHAAALVALLFSAGRALGQGCASNVSPGETFTFTQASSGGATPEAFSHGGGLALGWVDGNDYPSRNRVEATSGIIGILGAANSGFGQINYVFCVPGHPINQMTTTLSDQVTATISAQISLYGYLIGVSSGTIQPSATGSLTLIDLGTDGKGTNQVAAAPPIAATLNNQQITFSPGGVGLNINDTGGITNTTVPMSIVTTIIVGHMYAIEFNLTCQAHAGLLPTASICVFTPTLPNVGIPSFFTNLPNGDFHAESDNVTVALAPDQYAAILGIKAEVDALSAKISANDQDIAAAKLALEQENAQLLGLLNEIEGLLSKLQPADPPPLVPKRPPGPMRPRPTAGMRSPPLSGRQKIL